MRLVRGMHRSAGMLRQDNTIWSEIWHLPPGERFQNLYESYVAHDSTWLRGALLYAALGCFTIGMAFMFSSGPALFFLFLSALIVATQSSAVARQCDSIEVFIRAIGRKLRHRSEVRGQAITPLITAPPRDTMR